MSALTSQEHSSDKTCLGSHRQHHIVHWPWGAPGQPSYSCTLGCSRPTAPSLGLGRQDCDGMGWMVLAVTMRLCEGGRRTEEQWRWRWGGGRGKKRGPGGAGAHHGFAAGLGAEPVRGAVQFLGHHAQELGLVFTAVVVGGADVHQLVGRHQKRERQEGWRQARWWAWVPATGLSGACSGHPGLAKGSLARKPGPPAPCQLYLWAQNWHCALAIVAACAGQVISCSSCGCMPQDQATG